MGSCSTNGASEQAGSGTPCDDLGTHGLADSGGVRIHFVTKGTGPLVVLIHGHPDFWYGWRQQMPALAGHFQVVAIDLRGYNQSDQPTGVENDTIDKLVGDVDAVIDHFGREKATLVGHDWGGFISWHYAMAHPDQTERLVILNLPHPKGLMRELANNPQQQQASAYARQFQKGGPIQLPDGSTIELTTRLFADAVKIGMGLDEADHQRYAEALGRSSLEAMMNLYKANYPRPPYTDDATYPPVKCPVLMIHGLDDPFLLPGALNDTWLWVEKDLTLATVPGAGHWVHIESHVRQTDAR